MESVEMGMQSPWWLDDKVFAFATVLASGIFGLAVAVVAGWLTTRREAHGFKRQLRREKVDATRKLYEDAFVALDNLIIRRGEGDVADQNEVTRVMARLTLSSTVEIRAQFEKAGLAAQVWAANYRKSQPERVGDFLIIKSRIYTDAQAEEQKDESLYTTFFDSYSKLRTMMIEHLTALENEM